MSTHNTHLFYHETRPGTTVQQPDLFEGLPEVTVPETDWLADAAFEVLQLVSNRLPLAPSEKEKKLLDDAAEAFYRELWV